jgi:hypothetical protein
MELTARTLVQLISKSGQVFASKVYEAGTKYKTIRTWKDKQDLKYGACLARKDFAA